MSIFSHADHEHMARAIELARRGRFTVSPNPMVGCVIVNNGQVVGEGWHKKAGEGHAEVHALAVAGANAKGATCYVTLEPCSHFGRTPPCAQGLIDAGVARVVAAMVDPNPQVAGKGLAMLADAGIEVQSGLLEQDARGINPGFFSRIEKKRPYIQIKMAASLDGKTALANGESKWITGPDARADVQLGRAASCAILTGADTVIVDDARLNVRYAELPQSVKALVDEASLRQPVRVVTDSQGRLGTELSLFKSTGPIVIATTDHNIAMPEQDNVRIIAAGHEAQVDLPELMAKLAEQGVNNLWVEAGAKLAGAMLKHKLVDEIILYLAPKLMGAEGKGIFAIPEIKSMSDCVELNIADMRMLGQDIRLVLQPKFN